MQGTKLFLLTALTMVSAAAFGQTTGSYQVDVARTQGNMNCTISKANGGSVSCQMSISAQGSLPITMNSSSSNYVGVDKSDLANGAKFILAVVADGNKNLKDLVLIEAQSMTNQSFNGSVVVTEASQLTAISVDPLQVSKVDDQTYQLSLTFIAYAPAHTGTSLSAQDRQSLSDKILQKINPVVTSLN